MSWSKIFVPKALDMRRVFFLLAVCAACHTISADNKHGDCRPLTPETKANLQARFDTWVAGNKDKISPEELESRSKKFAEHLNGCHPEGEAAVIHDFENSFSSHLHDHELPATEIPADAARPPPSKTFPPLPPLAPNVDLLPDWQCVPDITHRLSVKEEHKFTDSCEAGFEDKYPWAFQDPFVPEPASLDTAAPGGKFYGPKDFGDLIQGKTVVFMGDSVFGQLVDGFDCEGKRKGVTTGMTPEQNKAMHLTGSTHPVSFKPSNGGTQGTVISRGDRQLSEEEIEKLLRPDVDLDVIVWNFGLHYHDMEVYTQNMTWFVKRLEKWVEDNAAKGKKRWVFFRDTSAQHFMGHGMTGDYDFREKFRTPDAQVADTNSEVTCGCIGINPTTHERDDNNRNTIMAKILKDTKFLTIPFFKTTFPRYNMHHENRMSELSTHRTCDCSHFCYMPPFFQWVIHEFYVAIRDGFAKYPNGM